MKSIKKAIGGVFLASGLLASLTTFVAPKTALALGWDPNTMIEKTTGYTGIEANPVDQASLAEWVMNFTTFAFGLAICLFVLKVVLTTINKMVFSNDGVGGGNTKPSPGNESLLEKIPIVGAYPPSTPWKEVWIHFGKQAGVVFGVWLAIQIIVNVLLFVFKTVMPEG